MDSFKEQIVRKIPTKNDKIQKIFIMIASVALAALCFIFPFGTQFSVIGIFLAAAALYNGSAFKKTPYHIPLRQCDRFRHC